MRDYFSLNTKNRLLNAKRVPHNIILLGSTGLHLNDEAFEIAQSYLDASDLSVHPDFMEVKPDGGSIKKESIEKVIATSKCMPLKADRRVFLIENAELLTEQAQNAMLKILEDNVNRDIFILVTEKRLLSTIHSRSETIEITGLTKEAFEPCDDIAYFASGGVPDIYNEILSDDSLYGILKNLPDALCNRKSLLKHFHAVKEKDCEFFFTARERWEIKALINCLKNGIEFAYISKKTNATIPEAFKGYERYSKEELKHFRDAVICLLERDVESLNKNDYFGFLLGLR